MTTADFQYNDTSNQTEIVAPLNVYNFCSKV